MPPIPIMAYSVRADSEVTVAQLGHEVADLSLGQVERGPEGGMPAATEGGMEFRMNKGHRKIVDGPIDSRLVVLLYESPYLLRSPPLGRAACR